VISTALAMYMWNNALQLEAGIIAHLLRHYRW
jgi:hypothetical protein